MKTKFEIVTVNSNEAPATEWLLEQDGVQVYLTYIPHTYTSCTKVYFVSGDNGDEFGQFATEEAAMVKAQWMLSLTKDERRKYDQ